MFDKHFKRIIVYVKENDIKSLVYKIYKKAMYKYYKNRIENYRIKSINKLETDTFKYLKTITYEEALLPINSNSKVSIILYSEGDMGNTANCLDSIFSQSTYENYEIIIIVFGEINNSVLGNIELCNTRIISYDKSVGYSSAINSTVKMVEGDYIVLLSDKVEIISPNWIEELQYCLNSAKAGAAWALLLPEGNILQEADLKVDANNLSGLASTRFCFMIDTKVFIKCNGLNEYYFTSYAGIDFCLRVLEMGITLQCTTKTIIKKITNEDEEVFDIMDKALFLNCWNN